MPLQPSHEINEKKNSLRQLDCDYDSDIKSDFFFLLRLLENSTITLVYYLTI